METCILYLYHSVFNMISIPVQGISRDHIYRSRLVSASLRLGIRETLQEAIRRLNGEILGEILGCK